MKKYKIGPEVTCNYCGISEEDVWHDKPHVCENVAEAENCLHSRLPNGKDTTKKDKDGK